MTTLEAYQETLDAIEELRQMGIQVHIKPSKDRNKQELIEKYSGPERIPPDKWVNVKLSGTLKPHFKAMAEKAKHLSWLGIYFDHGGSVGYRDWELDWSFKYTARPDGDAEQNQEIVEDLISTFLANKEIPCNSPLSNNSSSRPPTPES